MISLAISIAGGALDALESGGGIDLHDLRTVGALEHVDPCDAEAENVRGADGGGFVFRGELDGFGRAAAMHIAAEFGADGAPAHGGDDAVTDDEGPHILALTLGDKFLDDDLLFGALERLDDGFGDLIGIGQNDADTLRALEEFNHNGSAADFGDGAENAFAIPHEGGGGHGRRGKGVSG